MDYSDAAPDIAYTYTWLGKPARVTDAVGTRTFGYNAQFDLTSETIDGIYNKALTRTYTTEGMKGRTAGMSIDGTSLYGYDYDTYGRLSKITTAAGDFNYTRLANSDLVSQMTRPNGVTTSWSYELHRDLVTQVANGTVSAFNYVNNAIGNRTAMGRSGSAFTTPDTVNYTYNTRSEVVGALSNALPNYDYSYAYDPIGNRLTAEQAGDDFTYTANNLNQYTQINAEQPTYDADGNMLTRDGWTQVWNGENRMIAASKGNQRLEFDYDYMGRRIFKKVYDGETLVAYTRFVYDGYKLVQELNALNDNALLRQYVWQPEAIGLDVPLNVFDVAANQTYYYNIDANKNVSDLTAVNGDVVAHYEYTPFCGQTIASGAYTANLFRFSSEYFDAETDLVYYNYRYYDTEMGRWLSRDPIAEKGGYNLYGFIANNPIDIFDINGLYSKSIASLMLGFVSAGLLAIATVLKHCPAGAVALGLAPGPFYVLAIIAIVAMVGLVFWDATDSDGIITKFMNSAPLLTHPDTTKVLNEVTGESPPERPVRGRVTIEGPGIVY